jgi:acetyl-CoA carboxylase carboxyl transferase subunit beta
MGLFKKKDKELKSQEVIDLEKEIKKADKEDESLWMKCSSCKELLYRKEVEKNLEVCPKCSHHFALSVPKRIATLFDYGTFAELHMNIEPIDFLKFKDTKSYAVRLAETKETTKRSDAIVCGKGRIGGIEVFAAIFNFSFMGGSLGSVEGEKITRILEDGLEQKRPVIIVCSSGGARMQEGIISLMQMAKVSGAIHRLKAAGIPYLTILTDATLGGVTASMGMLGDIIIGEPKAMIGFAGARVIKETIKAELPVGFQRAEYLLEHGVIDLICPRKELKEKLHNILSLVTR